MRRLCIVVIVDILVLVRYLINQRQVPIDTSLCCVRMLNNSRKESLMIGVARTVTLFFILFFSYEINQF